ncbi:MAG: hypothetical protein AABX48_04755 [Nanoarchaeota archaeon]
MKYLFVCFAGVNRSPVAVDIARTLARKYKIKDFEAESFGYANIIPGANVSKLNQADIVFAMDQQVVEDLFRKGVSLENMCNLEIEDVYPIHEYPQLRDELERILTLKLEPFFDGSRKV